MYHDPVLEPRLSRVTDQEERVDKSHQPDLAGPALAVDQDVPGVDIAGLVNPCIALTAGLN